MENVIKSIAHKYMNAKKMKQKSSFKPCLHPLLCTCRQEDCGEDLRAGGEGSLLRRLPR